MLSPIQSGGFEMPGSPSGWAGGGFYGVVRGTFSRLLFITQANFPIAELDTSLTQYLWKELELERSALSWRVEVQQEQSAPRPPG